MMALILYSVQVVARRAHRRVRRRSRHRRRKGSPYHHHRNRRGLNPIRVELTTIPSTSRQRRHRAHHGPAHHPERGRSHHRIIVNPDDAIIVTLVLRSVVRIAGIDIVRAHWPGTDDGFTAVARLTGLDRPAR